MLDKAVYVNHLNQVLEFGSDGLFLTSSDMRDYEWSYDTNYDEITNFRKGVVKKKVKIIICAETKEKGIEKRNKIFEVFEQDVLSNIFGKFIINDYHFKCYFISSKKTRWYLTEKYIEIDGIFISDSPDWVREKTYQFTKNETGSYVNGHTKKYPYLYPYRYSNQSVSDSIINTSIVPSDFILRIYGSTTNPLIMIGENTYQVNVSLASNERLEINSYDKTILIIKQNGDTENVFWSAQKQSYIFEKIQTGTQFISWNGKFGFDLILLDKRSEPPW
jgi:hypothetical protein